ncbi:hypothetical protein Hanom_Chr10g00963601 [Helianthus anomalus]
MCNSIRKIEVRVNFRFAPCGLVTLTVLPQTFKNNHFPPIVCYGFSILLPASNSIQIVCFSILTNLSELRISLRRS